jgi:tetratricopeptide (TPR) repeat protein
MPRANPESAFEVAVRHLFRHVRDVDALRRNPLVHTFFANTLEVQDGAVLREIHDRILAESATLCNKPKEPALQARRRHAIIVALCAGESVPDTIVRLGLSRRHYYRERHAISTDVSRAIMQTTPKAVTGVELGDPLRLLITRAEGLVDQGFANKAATLLEEAWSCAPEGNSKSALRFELAAALVAGGHTDRAADLLMKAVVSPAEPKAEYVDDCLRDRQVLAEATLAMEIGRDSEARCTLEQLAKRQILDHRADETALDTILKCGGWYCGCARFPEARRMLEHARRLYQRLVRPSARLQISIALLAANCAEDASNEFSLEHHWLKEALTLSISSGSAERALDAISSLIFYYVSVGCDDEAYAYAKYGLAIAKTTEGSRLLEMMGVQIAVMLVRTRHWRSVDTLLFEVEKFALPKSFRWGLLKQAQGSFLTRAGRYRDAQSPLLQAYEIARSVKNRKLEGIVLRERAVALHHIGSITESAALMRDAVEIAEEHRSAYTLWVTCEAAARVLPDRRILRLAREAKSALSPRNDDLKSNALHEARSVQTMSRNGVRTSRKDRLTLR